MGLEERFPTFPEAKISQILEKNGITPTSTNYKMTRNSNGEPWFLQGENGLMLPLKYRTLKDSEMGSEEIKIGDTVMKCKAVIVQENGEERGAGIYIEAGGNYLGGSDFIRCGREFWKKPEDKSIDMVSFLLRL